MHRYLAKEGYTYLAVSSLYIKLLQRFGAGRYYMRAQTYTYPLQEVDAEEGRRALDTYTLRPNSYLHMQTPAIRVNTRKSKQLAT